MQNVCLWLNALALPVPHIQQLSVPDCNKTHSQQCLQSVRRFKPNVSIGTLCHRTQRAPCHGNALRRVSKWQVSSCFLGQARQQEFTVSLVKSNRERNAVRATKADSGKRIKTTVNTATHQSDFFPLCINSILQLWGAGQGADGCSRGYPSCHCSSQCTACAHTQTHSPIPKQSGCM